MTERFQIIFFVVLTALLFFSVIWATAVTILWRWERQKAGTLSAAIMVDPMTGLANERGMMVSLRRAVACALRSGQALTVTFKDANGLKRANDRHGHDVGDQLIKAFAKVVNDTFIRETDTNARPHGDEFVSILSGTDSQGALFTVKELMRNISTVILHLPYGDIALSMSIGVAVLKVKGKHVHLGSYTWNLDTNRGSGFIDEVTTAVLKEADRLMYRAKEAAHKDPTGRRSYAAIGDELIEGEVANNTLIEDKTP